MSAGIPIEFTAEDGKIRASLTNQAKGYDRIASSARGAARGAKELEAATLAANRAHRAPSASRQTSMIGRLIGGEGGHALSHGAHFAHLTGGFMAAGAAAIGLAVVFKSLFAASEKAVEAAREEAKVRGEVANAIHAATKSANNAAISAFKNDKDAVDTLVATGGDSAVNRARGLTRFGSDAIKGSAALAAKGQFNDANTGAAVAASRTGRISVGQAEELIAGGNISNSGSEDERAAQILSAHLGQKITVADMRRMASMRDASAYGRSSQGLTAREGGRTSDSLDRFANDPDVFADFDRESERQRNPGSARDDIVRILEEQVAIQRAAAAKQNRFVEAFETFLEAFGGSGSETQKSLKMHDAVAAAWGGN